MAKTRLEVVDAGIEEAEAVRDEETKVLVAKQLPEEELMDGMDEIYERYEERCRAVIEAEAA